VIEIEQKELEKLLYKERLLDQLGGSALAL
jgi:hypothetical protein